MAASQEGRKDPQVTWQRSLSARIWAQTSPAPPTRLPWGGSGPLSVRAPTPPFLPTSSGAGCTSGPVLAHFSLGRKHSISCQASLRQHIQHLKLAFWTSLAVQWLGLCVSTAGGLGSIPGRGTKIPHARATWPKKKRKEKKRIKELVFLFLFFFWGQVINLLNKQSWKKMRHAGGLPARTESC